MKKSATSKEELLAIAKEIAGREGIGNLNMDLQIGRAHV